MIARGRRGAVAAKHPLAAAAGLEILARGGNAVDAAVATAFALGVVEPWMSGLGGGGYLVVQPPGDGAARVVDYGLRAPLAATPDMFALDRSGATAPGLFPWPLVEDDANHHGWRAVAVPGAVHGLALALERFGRLDLPMVLAPAISLASDGVPVDWYTTLRIALDMPFLARDPETAARFLPGGFPLRAAAGGEIVQTVLRQPDLAETLRRVALNGPREMVDGQTGRLLAAALHERGGLITEADLAAYRASVVPALEVSYRGWRVGTVAGPSGGPTLVQALRLLDSLDADGLNTGGEALRLHVVARALGAAFGERYARYEDGADWHLLLGPARLAELRAAFRGQLREDLRRARTGGADTALTTALERLVPGGELLPAPASPATAGLPGEPGGTSTTHLSVADRDGMVVSCTQTLLSAWGSRVTVPGTGILLNNGMFWFDPRPGRPNAPGPGKRPLANMAPLVAVGPGGAPRVALGSAGGRRILSCNLQVLLDLIESRLPLPEALSKPRLDASTDRLLVDDRVSAETLASLSALGHHVLPLPEATYPQNFASPTAALVHADGTTEAAADPLVPGASGLAW